MKSFLRTLAASILGVAVFFALVLGAVAWKMDRKAPIRDHSWLVVDLYGALPAYHGPGGLSDAVLGEEGQTLHGVLMNLEKARHDERIDGVLLKLSSASDAGPADLQEIRNAVGRLRAGGKPVLGFSDALDLKTFLLGAACDSLFAPPSAYISLTGLSAVSMHVKKAMEKLDVHPQIHRIADYKAAAEMITREDMSEASKENRRWMLDEMWDLGAGMLAEDRGWDEARIEAAMTHALFTAEEAVEWGIVHRLLYWDELTGRLKGEKDDALRTVSAARYAQEPLQEHGWKGKKKIAVVHAHGMIGGRQSRVDPLLGMMMGHETIGAALRAAREDEDVVAVVFRIDSPGGESLASDLIGREVELCAKEKPVVSSMVGVAASGGYHIAYPATRIVADPMSVAGSIGSISGKFNLRGMYEKLGVTFDWITEGPMATLYSDLTDFTDEQWERYAENHWKDFDRWLDDVARRRNLTRAQAEAVAMGRVWSGRQAVENGLIDETGDWMRAVELAKELAGLDPDEAVALVDFPAKKELTEILLGGGDDVAVAGRSALAAELRTQLRSTHRLLSEGYWALLPEGFVFR